jgi:hypothetical protein
MLVHRKGSYNEHSIEGGKLMVKSKVAIARSPQSDRRTPDESASLFVGLEHFANLGDSYEDYCRFASRWPTFCPVAMKNSAGELLRLLPDKNCHALVMVFRDYLRSVWRWDAVALREQVLRILLGLANRPVGSEPLANEEEDIEWVLPDPSSPETLAATERMRELARRKEWTEGSEGRSKTILHDFDPRLRRTLWALMCDRATRRYFPTWPWFVADWARGEFSYEPGNDFQRAVYALFRQSWRARICRECQRLFVAKKHPQMFCGFECTANARRKRDLAFWKSKGSALRQKRSRKHHRHKGPK